MPKKETLYSLLNATGIDYTASRADIPESNAQIIVQGHSGNVCPISIRNMPAENTELGKKIYKYLQVFSKSPKIVCYENEVSAFAVFYFVFENAEQMAYWNIAK